MNLEANPRCVKALVDISPFPLIPMREGEDHIIGYGFAVWFEQLTEGGNDMAEEAMSRVFPDATREYGGTWTVAACRIDALLGWLYKTLDADNIRVDPDTYGALPYLSRKLLNEHQDIVVP